MKMNKYVKEFFHRGLMFSGFGPVVFGIIVQLAPVGVLDEKTVLTGIISTYLLAFVHAGASVFNSVESWSLARGLLFHLLTLYVAYISCYLVNSWLTFNVSVIAIFTLIFVLVYFAVWLVVYISLKCASKKMNEKL